MTPVPHEESTRDLFARADPDELFRNAQVLTSPHDLAAPEIFPDDFEFEEFLVSYRADRQRDLA